MPPHVCSLFSLFLKLKCTTVPGTGYVSTTQKIIICIILLNFHSFLTPRGNRIYFMLKFVIALLFCNQIDLLNTVKECYVFFLHFLNFFLLMMTCPMMQV